MKLASQLVTIGRRLLHQSYGQPRDTGVILPVKTGTG